MQVLRKLRNFVRNTALVTKIFTMHKKLIRVDLRTGEGQEILVTPKFYASALRNNNHANGGIYIDGETEHETVTLIPAPETEPTEPIITVATSEVKEATPKNLNVKPRSPRKPKKA